MMKIELPKMRIPMSTRIGHCHISEREYDRDQNKMDIQERLNEMEENDGEIHPCKMDI